MLFINFVRMNRYIVLVFTFVCVVSCQPSADDKAASQMRLIDSLYQSHDYEATLHVIANLRASHPKAVKSRRRALKIWQDASLKIAQADIARTDSALQATKRAFESEHDIGRRNRLGVKVDSLQVRYDALCGTVRVIHRRQKE